MAIDIVGSARQTEAPSAGLDLLRVRRYACRALAVIRNAARSGVDAFYNGALIRCPDCMDAFIAREEACHPSDNVGAPLAAEFANASGREFLTAMAITYHVQCRLTESPALAMRPELDHTLPLAISIAFGASFLLGLDEQPAAHAIALCASDGPSLGAARTGEHVSQGKGLAAPSAAFQAIHNIRLAHPGLRALCALSRGDGIATGAGKNPSA